MCSVAAAAAMFLLLTDCECLQKVQKKKKSKKKRNTCSSLQHNLFLLNSPLSLMRSVAWLGHIWSFSLSLLYAKPGHTGQTYAHNSCNIQSRNIRDFPGFKEILLMDACMCKRKLAEEDG